MTTDDGSIVGAGDTPEIRIMQKREQAEALVEECNRIHTELQEKHGIGLDPLGTLSNKLDSLIEFILSEEQFLDFMTKFHTEMLESLKVSRDEAVKQMLTQGVQQHMGRITRNNGKRR